MLAVVAHRKKSFSGELLERTFGRVGRHRSCKGVCSIYHNGFSMGEALIHELVSEKGHILNVLLEDLHMNNEFIDD